MKTIRGKIRTQLLLVSLLALALMSIVTVLSIGRIRNDVYTANSQLGTTASQISGEALENMISEQLISTAKTKAAVADEKLSKQQNFTQIIANYASSLYANPQGFKPQTVNPPNPALTAKTTAQLLWAEGLNPADFQEELGLMANCSQLMTLVPESDPDITANYIATESGFVIMADRDSDKKPEFIDGRERSWYKSAKAADKLIWTDVFNDAMGRGLAITCAAPVHDGNGAFKGVVGIGSLMTNLNKEIINTKIGETGYAFIVNQNGDVIISPKIKPDAGGNFVSENLKNTPNSDINKLISNMLAGTSGISRIDYMGREVYMACEPMNTLPWGVVTVVDVDEALAPSKDIQYKITDMTSSSIVAIDSSVRHTFLAVIAVVLAVLVMVFTISSYFSKKLTTPLAHLTSSVKQISSGNLNTKIDIKTGDEIELLANSFNGMTSSLQEYITDLTKVTAEKERIGAELNVATQIQASMLPCIFPAFPDYDEFDIFASMQPAKEVGGDFYDFFLIDSTHLGIVIADVSGKGVPAALFMVIAKTLIKNHSQNGEAPAEVLTAVNTQLCENNDAMMFVTAWVAILNITTGELTYGNAGHNPPLLRRSGESGFTFLKSAPGFVLAGMEGIKYTQASLMMGAGDVLFLYTDGVTEAINLNDELYSEERLNEVLDQNSELEVTELLSAVKVSMDNFVGKADQFDDITMLGLKFKGEENS
ncbi:MAG: SpoIIE family protein phosphatase [Oscillospiraceae bacterium]